MKKRWLAALLLLCAIAVFFISHSKERAFWSANLSINGREIDVAVQETKTPFNDQPKMRYYTLCEDGKRFEIDPFESDPVIFFQMPYGCFESEIVEVNGRRKIVNRLVPMRELENSPKLKRILEAVASTQDHDIFQVYIIQDADEYFVAVELNVNWWTPCTLYYYDQNEDQLIELCEFDSVEYRGIRRREPQNLENDANDREDDGLAHYGT